MLSTAPVMPGPAFWRGFATGLAAPVYLYSVPRYVYPHATKGKRPQRRINADGSNKTDIIKEPDYVGSSGHRAGQWVVGNDAGTSQWYVASHYAGSTLPGALAVVFVRADGSDVRFLAHHYSKGTASYRRQPHATVSPDGRLVAFELDKIGAAIEAAGLATGEFEPVTAQALAAQVLARMPQRVVAVEQAQDAVERVLMEAGYYDTARAYIVYRESNGRMRRDRK